MKKLLIALFGLVVITANGQEIDLDRIFKQFVIQNNNIDKCLFPEIYQSNDKNEVLEKWWDDVGNGLRMKHAYYLKLNRRLMQKILPLELADDFWDGKLSHEQQSALNNAKQKYKKTTNANCKNVRKYAFNLIEEYDEINDKWRKHFSEP